MKQHLNKYASFFKYVVFGLLVIRVFLNTTLPLIDTEEARYAEEARIMAETNNWMTLQTDYGLSLVNTSPLSIWLAAISIKAFGVNEFSVRLPFLALAITIIFFIGKYAKKQSLPFFLPGFILLTIPEFLLYSGMVATNTTLAFCVALTMLSFWEAIQENKKWYWKYLMFIGLGLGILAKGLIIILITIPPLIIWSIITNKTSLVLKNIPFILGLIITVVISLPWYFMAEKTTVGVLNNFLLNGHLYHFYNAIHNGEKIQIPTTQPLGIIWIFLLFFAIKWIQVVIYKVWKNRKELLKNEWITFLILWLIWSPLLFTFSKSQVRPYVMPIMTPIALLITYWFPSFKKKKSITKIALIIPILFFVFVFVEPILGHIKHLAPTDKYLIQNNVKVGKKIYHLNSTCFSSQFYSNGSIKEITTNKLEEIIKSNLDSFRVIVQNKEFESMALELRKKLQPLDKNHTKSIYGYYKR